MDITDRLTALVSTHPAVLFMKGTPRYPMCECSLRAVKTLDKENMPYFSVNILADPEIRAELPSFANWSTFPQLFLQQQLIGGCDIIEDLEASGELARLVNDVIKVSAA